MLPRPVSPVSEYAHL